MGEPLGLSDAGVGVLSFPGGTHPRDSADGAAAEAADQAREDKVDDDPALSPVPEERSAAPAHHKGAGEGRVVSCQRCQGSSGREMVPRGLDWSRG